MGSAATTGTSSVLMEGRRRHHPIGITCLAKGGAMRWYETFTSGSRANKARHVPVRVTVCETDRAEAWGVPV